MAMATKAKLLSRELKDVKTDLAITLQHCAQLEEENKRLKENDFKVLRHEEDDLVYSFKPTNQKLKVFVIKCIYKVSFGT